MQHDYRAVIFREKWAVEWYESGVRKRHSLGACDRSEVPRLVAAFAAERERQHTAAERSRGVTVAMVWDAYRAKLGDRPTGKTMRYEWHIVGPFFGDMLAESITKAHVESYIRQRQGAGKKEWTIYSELNHLRNALSWAAKQGMIGKAPRIEMPPTPEPRDLRMTREQARAILDACIQPHVKLWVKLALGTAGRVDAILGLTWDRVDFENGLIHLKDPTMPRTAKGRGLVGMPMWLREALLEAREVATCDYVVEYGGKRVGTIKKTIGRAAERAGLPWVTPHVFRHSAASWMARDGVPMAEIAQYLGHKDSRITERIYARFTPDYASKAVGALERTL